MPSNLVYLMMSTNAVTPLIVAKAGMKTRS